MAVYELAGGCWFEKISRAWLVLVRAECACGHRTRPHVTLDGAANALIRHQVATGTLVGGEP
jgi:hypothetical protein